MNLHPVVMAALELQQALEEFGRPFCFIGGLALQRWGQPRYTSDADATLLTDWVDDEAAVDYLLARFSGRRADARDFALKARVLLLRSSDDVHLDVALGALPFERRAVERASDWKYQDAILRTCCAEDLIVHKSFASRDQDWVDVEHILMAQGRKLNVRHIFEELGPLVELKDDPAILPRLEALMRKRDVID